MPWRAQAIVDGPDILTRGRNGAKGRRAHDRLVRQTSSNSTIMASASFCDVTPAASTFFMPRTYLAKSVDRIASIGALSTDTRSLTMLGDRRARAMAVFAPLFGVSTPCHQQQLFIFYFFFFTAQQAKLHARGAILTWSVL